MEMDGLLVVIGVSFVLIGALMLISILSRFIARRQADAASRSDPEAARETENETETDYSATTDWRSVKIAPGAERCEYASILTGKVFLIDEAPPLPLANCHQHSCSCRYIYLDDRRSGADRRNGDDDPGRDAPGQTGLGRRGGRRRGGRRAADLMA